MREVIVRDSRYYREKYAKQWSDEKNNRERFEKQLSKVEVATERGE
jgi:hypothetical protein